MKEIIFITGNMNKLSEAKRILTDYNVVNIKLDIDELQGTREYVAKKKAKIASSMLNKTVIIDDTSLCFDEFKGLPGVYIKDFLERLGREGLYNMVKDKNTKAQAVCSLGYCEPEKEPVIFEGITEGEIVSPRGDYFGWDPIFLPDGFNLTYAELEKSEKNNISHRYKALIKLKMFLESKSD